jgi:hypothetical protein
LKMFRLLARLSASLGIPRHPRGVPWSNDQLV